MDLEATWHEMEQRYEECHKALLRMARMSSRFGHEGKAIVVGVPVEVIEPAVSAGLVGVEDGKARFKDERVWLYAVCEYLVSKVLLRAWKDDEKLWAAMRAIYLRGSRINCDALAATAVEVLHNRYGMDVVKRVGELCNKGKDFWNVLHAFAEALPKLQVEAASLRETLRAIEQVIRNDLAGIEAYDGVEKLCELQGDTGEALYRELVAEKKGAVTGFIPYVVRGMSKNDFGRAYTKATALLESDWADLVSAGIIALGSMEYSEDESEYLEKTLRQYRRLRKRRKVQVAASLVKGYGRLLEYVEECKEALVQLSQRKGPEVLYEVAIVLSLKAKSHCRESWFRRALMNLAEVEGKYPGIVQRIDGVLSRVAGENDYDLVTSFWEAWVLNRSYGRDEQGNLSVFKGALSRMTQKCLTSVRKCWTDWFNADDHRLHLAAADLVRELCHRRRQVPEIRFELDGDVLKEMSSRDVVYVIYKILAYASVDPGAVCSMVFSAIGYGGGDEMVIEHVVAAFRDYIAYNYAGTTVDFLRERSKSKRSLEADTASRILREVDAYYAPLRGLSHLAEFEAPPQRVQQVIRAKEKHYGREMAKAVREKSVFLQFCKEIQLKAGSSFFMEKDGEFGGKTNLAHFSQSMEFPRGEIIDPVGQAFLRLGWRNLKREELT